MIASRGMPHQSRCAIALAAALLLSACDLPPDLLGPTTDLPETGIRAMGMYDGSVVAQAPTGFCIDERSTRATSGFAVMGSCALTSRMLIMPQVEAMITVQFGEAGSASVTGAEADLISLFRTAQGVALLSATGRPDGIFVEGIDAAPGVVMVRFTETAPPIAAGLERVEWRAFLDLAGRLTTITVRGFERAPLDRMAGLALMRDVVQSLRVANGMPGATG